MGSQAAKAAARKDSAAPEHQGHQTPAASSTQVFLRDTKSFARRATSSERAFGEPQKHTGNRCVSGRLVLPEFLAVQPQQVLLLSTASKPTQLRELNIPTAGRDGYVDERAGSRSGGSFAL